MWHRVSFEADLAHVCIDSVTVGDRKRADPRYRIETFRGCLDLETGIQEVRIITSRLYRYLTRRHSLQSAGPTDFHVGNDAVCEPQ